MSKGNKLQIKRIKRNAENSMETLDFIVREHIKALEFLDENGLYEKFVCYSAGLDVAELEGEHNEK